jgi:hypothetical protein
MQLPVSPYHFLSFRYKYFPLHFILNESVASLLICPRFFNVTRNRHMTAKSEDTSALMTNVKLHLLPKN